MAGTARGSEPQTSAQSTNGPTRAGAIESTAQSRFVVPGESVLALLGSRDENLRVAEELLDADIHVRGNEVTLSGEPGDVAFAERVFAELVTLAGRGQPARARRGAAHRRDALGGRSRVAGRGAQPRHRVPARPHDPAQDAQPEAVRRRDRRAHRRLLHRPGRHRQDLPRHGQGRAGAAGQAGQPHHPHPPGRRGGRAARVPARHALREDRPLPAAALRRAARHDRPRVDPAADAGRHDRGGPAGVHARPDPQRRVHHPRRGAEHLARADEDVPHPARVRLQDRRHRRHHPGRPAGRPAERAARRPGHPRRRRRRPLLRADQPRRRPAQAGRGHRRRLRPVARHPGRRRTPDRAGTRGPRGQARRGR